MKFFLNNWRLMLVLLEAFIILPFALWWLDNRLELLMMPWPYYILPGFILWIGFFVLYMFIAYLVRGYFIYQSDAEILVYKARGKKGLDFYVTLRYTNRDYENGNYEGVDLHIPSDDRWKEEMPDWAKERKQEIVQQLRKNSLEVDRVQFVEI